MWSNCARHRKATDDVDSHSEPCHSFRSLTRNLGITYDTAGKEKQKREKKGNGKKKVKIGRRRPIASFSVLDSGARKRNYEL